MFTCPVFLVVRRSPRLLVSISSQHLSSSDPVECKRPSTSWTVSPRMRRRSLRLPSRASRATSKRASSLSRAPKQSFELFEKKIMIAAGGGNEALRLELLRRVSRRNPDRTEMIHALLSTRMYAIGVRALRKS
ncbi:hypothetical protein BJX65DRAFT_67608 [Aspergillus insuetus]